MRVVEGTAEIESIGEFLGQLDAVASEFDCTVQAFDAEMIAGRAHLESAVAHARRSFERGENVARDRGVEIMCYAAGRRQIDQALALGVSDGENRLVVMVESHGDGDEDDAVDAVTDLLEPAATLGVEDADEGRIQTFFGITDAERAATTAGLPDLVCERVALLDVEK